MNITNSISYLTMFIIRIACVAGILFSSALLGRGQGTLHITFDGPPYQPPGSMFLVQQYSELGMYFRPIPGTDGFARTWTNMPPEWPNNGTPYLQATAGDSLMFSYQNGPAFGLISVDLARATIGFPDYTVNFIGYRPDGSTISTTFAGANIAFQTHYFGPEWLYGLTRVEIPNHTWSLDNLVVFIPEPATNALLIFAALAVGRLRLGRRRV
jgi:hypothetical protein